MYVEKLLGKFRGMTQCIEQSAALSLSFDYSEMIERFQ